MFYHRIIVEMNEPENKEVILVKCIESGSESHSMEKRSVLPAGFQEPEYANKLPIEIIHSIQIRQMT